LPARNYSEGSRKILGSSAAVSARAITAEIRHLTINNTSSFNSGVYTTGVTNGSFSMLHVTATATGGTNENYGVSNLSSSPSMTNVTATATGGTNSYGVKNEGTSSPTIRNSSITGTTNSISNDLSSSAKVADTALGGAVGGAGFTCVGVYDTAFVAFATTSCV
jgi:hypothetical protein